MENILPDGFGADNIGQDQRPSRAARSGGYRIVVGKVSHPVLELRADGFVIAADGRPPLRGFADVFHGDERVLHGLVTCAWADNGRVGYDFKRGTHADPVPADYVRPAHAGLLNG